MALLAFLFLSLFVCCFIWWEEMRSLVAQADAKLLVIFSISYMAFEDSWYTS